MHVLSFDIGIKNFSFSLVDFNTDKNRHYDIIHIENIDLCPDEKVNKQFIMDQKFYRRFHQYLKTKHYIFERADLCLIEKQLSKKNYKATNLFHQLQAHLYIFFSKLRVIGYSPSKKYTFISYSTSQYSTYRQRKNWGIEFSLNAIKLQQDDVILDWFNSYKKKDDIADCLICSWNYMIQYYNFRFKDLIE